ncbi:MAG: AAA family ATPase, partial [Patescibacteria group bacterium]
LKDYTQYIEKNSSLGGIFAPVDIKEVEKDKAILICEIHAGSIEAKNQVYFSYAAIEKAVELSDRFIHNQYLPQKAIGILENAAVMAKKAKGCNALVLDQDVAEIVSQISNVPVTEVGETETEKLLHLEEKIHEKVIGQDQAVKAVASAVRRARAELRETKRPIANLLFLGPTGVGKTQLAKTLAEVYFGAEKNMIRLDMSEFQDQSGIARFIGTSRGGDGLLTEPVRKNPFSLVLLDEIEKADKDIINIFLQVMEDGRLTDGSGQVIDFTNTIIIATSNAGTGFIQDQIKLGIDIEEITKQLIETHLKPYYRPEFLNRLDEVIVFKPLQIEEVKQITKLLLGDVATNLEAKGVTLEVTDVAIAELAQMGFDPTMGARPLKRVIQEKVRDVLATYVLENRLERRDKVVFDVGGKVEIRKPND